MVLLRIKLQKEAYFPGEEVEGWMELKHKGFKPTVIDKLVVRVRKNTHLWPCRPSHRRHTIIAFHQVEGEESEKVMVMHTAQTTSRQTLIDCKQILLDQQVSFGPGTYYFPFTLTLPEYLPCTGIYGRQDRKYTVQYAIKAFALKFRERELQTISNVVEAIPVYQRFDPETKGPTTVQVC